MPVAIILAFGSAIVCRATKIVWCERLLKISDQGSSMKTVTLVSRLALVGALATAQPVLAAAPAVGQAADQAPAVGQDGPPGAAAAADSEIIVTGTRTTGLKASDSPAPIQVLGNDMLKRVGQTDLVQALAQQLPSIQAQGFGNDQAAFHPSIKLRGLNPNHTLVLVDGKRRHGTSSIVVTGGPFGGNAAADISLIPQDAIDHIEVLQDGAAAQYGTDAIAGVINIILKHKDHGGDINVTGGKYIDQGGQSYSVMGNVALAPFEGAYLDLTAERKFKNYSFRGDLDPRVVDTGFNTSANTGTNGGRYNLARFPGLSSVADYPYVNRISGDGKLLLTTAIYAAGWQITPDIEIYAKGSYARKKGFTYQNFRLPVVVFGKRPLTGTAAATSAATSADIAFPTGFKPQEKLLETDYEQTVGVKGNFLQGTTFDLSSTYGRNVSGIYVINSANAALYYDTSTLTTPGYTPRDVHNGDFAASQWTNTLDLTHQFDVGFEEPVTLAGGLEYRREMFQLKAGEVASYYVGTGVAQGGIQSFFGYSPANAGIHYRHNFSQYLDVNAKPFAGFVFDGAVRHEHYDDFGSTTIFKGTGRYDFSPMIAIRGTVSTGFRAPTLAEGFYSGINVSVSSLSGIFPPNSAGAAALGISNLKPEKSTNFSGGLVLHPMPRLTMTIDAYSIRISNRIVRSSSFLGASSSAGALLSPSVITALRANGVPVDSVIAAIAGGASGAVGINTFVNGVTTLTQGIDFLATYASDFNSLGHVDWSLATNYNKTTIKKINAPPSNINQAVQLLDVYAQADLTKTTPKWRVTAGAYWTLGKLSLNLRESYYGSHYTIISEPLNGAAQDRLGIHPSFITDAELGFQIAKPVKIAIGANNLFNKYPTKYPAFIRAQQYQTSSTGYIQQYPSFSAIGQNGGYYYGRVTVTF